MNWKLIESNWEHDKDVIRQQWEKLTDDHLGKISGKREQLISQIQQCYDVTSDQAERQVKDWEAGNNDVFAETAAEVRKHVGISRQ